MFDLNVFLIPEREIFNNNNRLKLKEAESSRKKTLNSKYEQV